MTLWACSPWWRQGREVSSLWYHPWHLHNSVTPHRWHFSASRWIMVQHCNIISSPTYYRTMTMTIVTTIWLYLTDNVTLKFPGEYCVHDAGTLGGLDAGFVDQMSVQQVQGGDEELMGILLLITSWKYGIFKIFTFSYNEIIYQGDEHESKSCREVCEERMELWYFGRIPRNMQKCHIISLKLKIKS